MKSKIRNILRKDSYLIDNSLQNTLVSSSKDVYSKGIYLVKVWKVKC